MSASGAWRWALRAPAERLTLPVCALCWPGAEAAHLAGAPWQDIALGTLAAAGLAYGRVAHRAQARTASRRDAGHAATGITAAGTWLTAAAWAGPYGGPWHALTWIWAGGSLGGYFWLRRHEAVAAAREWRRRKDGWLGVRHRWGLGGSFLVEHEPTRLGERLLVDVTGTGKLASQVAGGNLAERIAQDRRLPRSRVRVAEARLAGQVEISIRDRDPWARPVPHPALSPDPETDLSGPYSITRPAVIGIDPETGDPLPLLLCGPGGGRNITVVAILEWGKTTLLNCVSERVTAASDALLVRVNVSVKGDEERDLWAPACHLTALGPRERGRAVRVLEIICRIIEWRAQQPKTRANWLPSAQDPHIVIIIDEMHALAQVRGAAGLLRTITSEGRQYGISVVRGDQRGTAERHGGGDVRAMDSVFILGAVNRSGEAMHAAGDLGLHLPDIAAYGEGRKGVWAVAELGGSVRLGRAFNLSEPDDIRRLAAQRAMTQPDLCPALSAFLGEAYLDLLASDVFARWARRQSPGAVARPRPDVPLPREGALPGAVAVASEDDALARLDAEAEAALDDDGELRRRWREAGRKIGEARQVLGQAGPVGDGGIPPAAAGAAAEAAWGRLGREADLPPGHRETLNGLLRAGTTIREVHESLGVSKWTARVYLERLRAEGLARVEGERRNARWHLAREGDGS